MHQTQLIKLLRTFSEAEMKAFSKLLQSPFFTTNPHLFRFFNILKKYHPDFDSPKLEKQKLYKRLFPGQAYNDVSMRKVISLTKGLVERFLVQQGLNNNPNVSEFLLIEELGKRNLYARFEKEIKEKLAIMEKEDLRDMDYYLKRFLLHRMLHFHPNTFRNKPHAEHIQGMDENLNHFFALSKLHLGTEIINRKKLFAEDSEVLFLKEVLEKVEEEEGFDLPLIKIYKKVISLLGRERDDELFRETKRIYCSQILDLGKRDQSLILIILLNYCISVYLRGDGTLLSEQYDLYQIGLNNQILVSNERITTDTFLNIIVNGAVLGKFDEVSEFIDTYSAWLDFNLKEDILHMSMAYLNFYKKNYPQTEFLLQSLDTKSNTINFRVRFLFVMVQFEVFVNDTGYFETFKYQLEAFEKYIRRTSFISENIRKSSLNFIRIINKMAFNINGDSRISDSYLENEINKTDALNARYWLLLKLKKRA